jgi:CheY-like chemotaxis protein
MAASATVLVIDDDRDYVVSVRTVLENKGYTVIEASSGKAALRKLVEQRPEVILLDIMMEDDSAGYGVNYSIKHQDAYAEFRNIPIIMASAIQESPDELYGRASEVDLIRPDLYLTKPLDIPRLLEVVEQAVARYRTTAP